MIRNLSLHFDTPLKTGDAFIVQTARSTEREYDVVPGIEEIVIRLDPYELDALTLNEADGCIIVSHIKNGAEREVVYSAKIQDP